MTEKTIDLIAFLSCLSLIFLILILDIGYGLILTLSLYCIAQAIMKTLTKKIPFFISKIITSFFIISFFISIYFIIQFCIKYGIAAFKNDNGHTLQSILISLNDAKDKMPILLSKKIPTTISDMEIIIGNITGYINQHIVGFGGSSLNYFFQTLFSLIISISLIQKTNYTGSLLTIALKKNFHNFIQAFKILMGAQIYVAMWNSACLALYLFVVLPIFHVDLAYRKTLVLTTLFLSLVPALGNVVANTILLILCFPFGFYVMLGSLIFMILIHKAEYLINARIIGKNSHANVIEILLALIIFEILFGLDGLILGPIVYTYVKNYLIKTYII